MPTAFAPRGLLSIVIPAFNEGARLATSLAALQTGLPALGCPWEVVVVDDGSSDDTVAIAQACARTEPRVRVALMPHRGKGAALKAGLLAAGGALRFMCDADLSMPVAELARFLDPALGRFDLAIGCREGPSARRIAEPTHRHVMGRVFNAAVQRLALPGIEDSQCGFKLFTRHAVEAILPRVSIDGWAFDLEVLVIARALGLRIVDVPIEWHFRPHSRVHLLRDGAGMLSDLLRIRRRTRRGEYQA